MRTILSQCVAGLQEVALRALQADLGTMDPVRVEDGMVVYRTNEPAAKVRALPYLNNSFLVLHSLAGRQAQSADAALAAIVHQRGIDAALRSTRGTGERTFRLFISSENELVSGPPQLVSQLRSLVQSATGLRFHAAHADAEYWVMRRRSGSAFFLKRITRRGRTEKDLAQGELRPELAHLLCRLSEPAATDVFLDPFAGSGAIPFARIRYPYNLGYAFDSDPATVAAMKERKKSLPAAEKARAEKLIIRQADALAIEKLDDGFVDKVVTDPPWGLYRELPDAGAFYHAALRELARVTKPGGIIVLLTANDEAAEAAVAALGAQVRVEESHRLLVAGKKARVFRIRRTAASAPAR
jgi:predicted RNA methylase